MVAKAHICRQKLRRLTDTAATVSIYKHDAANSLHMGIVEKSLKDRYSTGAKSKRVNIQQKRRLLGSNAVF